MKKSSFMKDSFVSILGIVICKIIGLVYVVPFYAMISTAGGALYSYAYSIYSLFLSLSTSGIPAAMSKIISEYNALGYDKTKVRVYKIGLSLIIILGFVGFVSMMAFATPIAHLLIGNMKGGNSISDIAFVIRVISTALLVVPVLSVTKGYFQGEKHFKAASIANVIEQLARVIFLLLGCYLILNVFKLDEKIAIGAAVFSATVGALVACVYLLIKMKKDKADFSAKNAVEKQEETKLNKSYLTRQIINCAVPFIIIDLLKSAYSMVDAVTVVRGMNYLGYSAKMSEIALSTLATWGAKLLMIVISISVGLTISLIPNLAADNIKGEKEKVNHKINLSLIVLLFITIPMTVGISILAKPVWVLFYSYDVESIQIFRLFIYTAATFSIYSVVINIAQTLNHTKQVLITLSVAFVLNLIGNIPFMILCHYVGIPAYLGTSICTLITELGPAIVLLNYLKKQHDLKFKELWNKSFKILLSTIMMIASLYILSIIYKLSSLTRFGCLIEILVYSLVGAIVYLLISYKTGLLKDVLNEKLSKKILNKLKVKI